LSSEEEDPLPKLNRANREAARLRKLEILETFYRDPASSQASLTAQFAQARLSRNPDAESAAKKPSVSKTPDDMSKPVLFYGKNSQIDDVLTFCTVKFLADDTVLEQAKAGYLASLFRGSALQWLTTELKTKPAALDSYEQFTDRVKAVFALDDTAKQSQAARSLVSCRQKSSVQDYALRFRQLSSTAAIPEQTAIALFKKGLKQSIRTALVTQDEQDTLDEAIAEATRLDSQLFYARGSSNPSYGRQKPRRNKKGQWTPGKGVKQESDY
jgi:hypothetical protein